MQFLRLFGLALLAIITACGSASPDDDQPSIPNPVRYVPLGDSLAFGLTAERGYVSRYNGHLRSALGVNTEVINLAIPGWTSSDLLAALATQQFRQAVSAAHVITFNIGGNDLREARSRFLLGQCGGADGQQCMRDAVAEFKANWDAILRELLALRSSDHVVVRTMDIYNPYVGVDGGRGILTLLRPYLDETNQHIQSTASQAGIPVAAVYAAFNGPDGMEDAVAKGLIASDGLHANDAGHELIAALLRDLGFAPLR